MQCVGSTHRSKKSEANSLSGPLTNGINAWCYLLANKKKQTLVRMR